MSVENNRNRVIDRMNGKWLQAAFTLFVCCLACGLYYYFLVDRIYAEIELDVAQKCDFKIYWAQGDQLYSEKNMSVVIATPERKKYSLFLPSAGKISRLRIDTHNYQGEAILKKLVLQQEGWVPVTLSTPEQFKALVPLFDIEEWGAGDEGLWVKSAGKDPNFELVLAPERQAMAVLWLVVRFVAIAALVACAIYGAAPLAKNLRFVPVLLFGIWLLVIAMAAISKQNSHPDEYVHMSATSYYQDHWLPPAIEDPAIRDTYSVYGVSRLNNGEIYYLFSGKFEKFAQAFKLPEYLAMRLFNVCLFGLILLYTIRNRYARMAALPFLVTPQLWYLFSYCTSDAFALFFAFLAACELIDPASLLHRCLKGESRFAKVAGPVVLGVLLGIVFLLKKNYYPFIAFFYLCLAVKIFFTNQFYWEKKEAVLRLVLITFIACAVFGLRTGADYFVNGLHRDAQIVEMEKKLADPWYNPDTELAKKHITLYRKARGVTLEETILRDRWFEISFQTAFGVYGYFTISGTPGYYDLVRWSGVALLVFVFGSIFLRGGLIGSGLAVTAFGLGAALIGASLYHSWAVDFQAQGRYLFPILPMLGIVYGINHEAVNRRLFLLLLLPHGQFGTLQFHLRGSYADPQDYLLHDRCVVTGNESKITKIPLREQLHSRESSFRKYWKKAGGDISLPGLFLYELFALLAANLGGAVGFWVRKRLAGWLFRSAGTGLILGRGLTVRHPARIDFGDNVGIDDYVYIDASGSGDIGIQFHDGVIVSRNCVIHGKHSYVVFEERVDVGCNCIFASVAGITIGAATIIGANCYLGGGRYNHDQLEPAIMDQGVYSRGEIVVGEKSWIGSGAVILDGVRIGCGVIVGAGSVVTKNIPDYAVVAGVPARDPPHAGGEDIGTAVSFKVVKL